jgi:hypothetical protein
MSKENQFEAEFMQQAVPDTAPGKDLQPKNSEEDELINVLVKFKTDLIWDEIVGIFEKVPASLKQQLENQFEEALKLCSQKLGTDSSELREKVEDIAYNSVNGITYSQKQVTARLAEYGIIELEDEIN